MGAMCRRLRVRIHTLLAALGGGGMRSDGSILPPIINVDGV